MSLAIFALLILFVAAQVYVEAVNEGPDCHWWQESMSHYLGSVQRAGVQVLAYLGFALAEVLLIFHDPRGTAATVALALAAAGLVGVTLTGISNPEWKWHPQVERAHTICAGFAFGGALVAQFIYLWHTPSVWFPMAAVACTLAFVRFAPNANALEEKTFALWVVAGFIAITGLPF
jgi:hypothetical protein